MRVPYSRSFSGPGALVLIVAVCVLVLSTGDRAFAQATPAIEQLRLLTALGNAEVRVRPDLAIVRLGVETESPTASQARQENARRTTRVIDAIKALRIPEADIQTSIFQIEPVRRFPPGETPRPAGEPPIVGYRVSNIVSVRTTNFDLVGRIIDESVRAGANRVDSVNFVLQNDDAPRQRALQDAVSNARANAQAMARALDVELVRIQTVQQGGVGVLPPQPFYTRTLAAEAAAPTPILPGEVMVNASATVTYVIR